MLVFRQVTMTAEGVLWALAAGMLTRVLGWQSRSATDVATDFVSGNPERKGVTTIGCHRRIGRWIG